MPRIIPPTTHELIVYCQDTATPEMQDLPARHLGGRLKEDARTAERRVQFPQSSPNSI